MLEVCPTSNVVLGAYPSYAEHPFPLLRDAGVRVTLGSDDPPYWDATIGGEYAVARREWGLDDAALRGVTAHGDRGRVRPRGPRKRALSANSAMSRRAVPLGWRASGVGCEQPD